MQPDHYNMPNITDYNYYYYEEYKKLYVASFMLSTQVLSGSNVR